MSGVFQFAVRSQTELDSKLTAVERISYYYKNIKQEASETDTSKVLSTWPQKGEIEFSNVVLRYQNDAQSALNNLSFKIENGEKIGVVGRTGSGRFFYYYFHIIKQKTSFNLR